MRRMACTVGRRLDDSYDAMLDEHSQPSSHRFLEHGECEYGNARTKVNEKTKELFDEN
jgi:hypothetical protein